MDTENESLPTGERASVEQQTESTAQVPPQTNNPPLAGQPVTPVPRIQRITHFLEGFQPTPGSNVTRILWSQRLRHRRCIHALCGQYSSST